MINRKILFGIAIILFAISLQCISGFEIIGCVISAMGLLVSFIGYLENHRD